MVLKPFAHLARQSIVKTFSHGYAQSVVAATQSSYASSTTPLGPLGHHASNRYGRPQTAQLHTVFQNAHTQCDTPEKVSRGIHEGTESHIVDLRPYLDAWEKGTHFEFIKRIGWKPPSVVPSIKARDSGDIEPFEDLTVNRGGLERAHSANAVYDFKEVEGVAESAAVVTIDEAIAREISDLKQSIASQNDVKEVEPELVTIDAIDSDVDSHAFNGLSSSSADDVAPSTTISSISPDTTTATLRSSHSSSGSSVAVGESKQSTEHQSISEHLILLHQQRLYDQIPPAFKSLLVQGFCPTVQDYNILLESATNLPATKHQIVPKVLDVYSNLLQHKVTPDTKFYATLIEALSRRALDVFKMKGILEDKQQRFGGTNGSSSFLFKSSATEYDILREDDALLNATRIFQASSQAHKWRPYPTETYSLLIVASATYGKVKEMTDIYQHMESNKVLPDSAIFRPMIEAYARSGDLINAVECYNDYKKLAIQDDAGRNIVTNRKDNEIYAALIKAYVVCGKIDGAHRFFNKVVESLSSVTEHRELRIKSLQDIVASDALIAERLDADDHLGALKIAEERDLTDVVRQQVLVRICITAADHGDVHNACKVYQYLWADNDITLAATLAMFALYARQGNLNAATTYWDLLSSASNPNISFVEPTALFAIALIRGNRADEGLRHARESFSRIRAASGMGGELRDQIDEAIVLIGEFLAQHGVMLSANANVGFLWAMVENGGFVSPIAEQILAKLGPQEIASLSRQDMTLALQAEACLLQNRTVLSDAVAHVARFSHLLDIAVSSRVTLDGRTTSYVEKAVASLDIERPDLLQKWQTRQQLFMDQAYTQVTATPQAASAVLLNNTDVEAYDPYAATTDYRGSTIVAEELETRRTGAGLNEALSRFRNIRRAGRHPRYIVYAKLISAAAKEGRTNLIHDILGMARNDVPYLPQYAVVRHGWSSILDSMVGACLTTGRRPFAADFHQEMLNMGTAPSANTYGLYITTLKESTKTFDEASEAVSIFGRAISEGVVPSSFLYNALIGKLGKARRIDDCLRYFQEMRAAGIRPTSVTYGTVVNALCRVSDDRFAEELFDEMERMPNYKPRPAPYNSLMQFFLTTKHDSVKVLSYYKRMQSMNIEPTMHTYKLLIDTYSTLEPINLSAAEGVLDTIRSSGQQPEAVHYASLIHAKGCTLRDMEGALQIFEQVLANGEIRPQACLYQALFESMVANHCVSLTEEVLDSMSAHRVEMTPYIANTLIHGWAMENVIAKAKAVYDSVGIEKREPSTYEAMTRAFLTCQDRDGVLTTVNEMLSRGYPSAVSAKVLELVGHCTSRTSSSALSMSTI